MAAKYRRWTPEVVRSRIRTGMIVKALMDHCIRGTPMAQSQIAAGLGLLRKVMPDLTAMSHSGKIEDANQLSTSEIHRRIAALEGAIDPQGSLDEPPEVH